jgi:hypothetical protein
MSKSSKYFIFGLVFIVVQEYACCKFFRIFNLAFLSVFKFSKSSLVQLNTTNLSLFTTFNNPHPFISKLVQL